MLLDELFSIGDHHWHTSEESHAISLFPKTADASGGLSTGATVGISVGVTSAVGAGMYFGYRTISKWSLRDTATQVPDYDPSSITPTGSLRAGSVTPPAAPGMHGETGDPSEFLSPTPTGRVRKNTRARFF